MTRRRLPVLPADEVLRVLERAGFNVQRIKAVITTCAIRHGLRRGRSDAIIREAGLSVEEFLDLL